MTPSPKPIVILMADDDAEDRMLAKEALNESRLMNTLLFAEDGEELLLCLRNKGKYSDKEKFPRPGLILLDLNMPKKDGREALKEIKADKELRSIPVVILTTSKAEEDIVRSYDLGVNSYITKPVSFGALVETMRTLGKYWFEIVELPCSHENNRGAK
jgi:CheY-like chemotaxis protein